MARFRPTRVVVIDVDRPLPPLPAEGADGRWHHRVMVVARHAGRPIGSAVLDIGNGLGPVGVARALSAELGPVIERVAPGSNEVPPQGLAASASPPRPVPAVSVVVATRDRPEALARCLTSIAASDHPHLEVLVVDNAPSDDGALTVVEGFRTGPVAVRYLREDRPGLARAHNAALPFVEGDVVAVTDDDVTVDPTWARRLAEAFAVADAVGCVTGLILPSELETATQAWTDSHAAYNKGYERRVVSLDDDEPGLLPWATGTIGSGANMAFDRRALATMGGFDDALGAGTLARGGDDLAAFHDVLRAGYRIVYEPAAIVHHRHHADPSVVRRLAFSYGVALGAHLARSVVEHPAALLDMAGRLPAGLRHGARVTRPAGTVSVPGLERAGWRQRAGVLFGPWSYVRSRRHSRRAVPA